MNSNEGKGPDNIRGESGDEALEKRTRDMLRDSADNLDARTRSRLTQARSAAVEEARLHGSRTAWQTSWRILVPAGSLAAAAALAFLLWSGRQDGQDDPLIAETPQHGVEGPAQSPIDDLEILVASESFELLEDLEFYASIDIAEDTGADIG